MDIPPEALTQLKMFITLLKASPQMLHKPELRFLKEFVESFGGKVPPPSTPTSSTTPNFDSKPFGEKPSEPAEPVIESEESDVEIDDTGVIEPDEPEPLKEYEPTAEVSDEAIEKSNEKKIDAINAYQEGDLEKAFQLFSEAIEANPNSALLYAKRGQCSLKRNKGVACIQDCTRAVAINPDCAPAYKYRGRAHRLLGHWEEAAKDLRVACKIDFDEEADEWLKEVTPNARKLEEHRRKYERKNAEKELRERTERIRRAREEHAKAAAQQRATGDNDEPMSGANDIFGLMNDPELRNAFADPEVASAFEDISSNPGNLFKYQNNPKIQAIIEKIKSKYGKMAGAMGGGFGGFNPFSSPPPPPPSGAGAGVSDDVGLD